jgi:hypothetical protein
VRLVARANTPILSSWCGSSSAQLLMVVRTDARRGPTQRGTISAPQPNFRRKICDNFNWFVDDNQYPDRRFKRPLISNCVMSDNIWALPQFFANPRSRASAQVHMALPLRWRRSFTYRQIMIGRRRKDTRRAMTTRLLYSIGSRFDSKIPGPPCGGATLAV